jgi:sporulation protein YlmC with PRC-barrel domain
MTAHAAESHELHELHAERLLGRRVRDVDGRSVGRIEELRLGVVNGETVIVEFHLGPEGLVERLGGAALELPFLRALAPARRGYHVPWTLIDLSDVDAPRLRCRARELRRSSTPHEET